MVEYNEKAYRKIGLAGGVGIVVGIVLIVFGVTVGVLSIVFGAKALNGRKYIID